MTHRPLLALVLAGVLALGGCSQTAPKQALGALPAPSPSPSPTPTVAPVTGTVELETVKSSHPTQLGFPDDGAPAEGSVQAAGEAVAAALDTFLDAAQRDQADLATIRGVWLEQADPAAAEVLRTGLTNGDNPVTGASYVMAVHVEPDPVLVAVHAAIGRHDGTTASIELVFDVTGDQPLLHLAGAAEVT